MLRIIKCPLGNRLAFSVFYCISYDRDIIRFKKCKFTVIIAKISYKKGNNIINQGSVLTEP